MDKVMRPTNHDLKDVYQFWQSNPLFTGEGASTPGTLAWFQEHERVIVEDCFAGREPGEVFTNGLAESSRILDVGCGPGYWVRFFLRRGFPNVQACDLTDQAVELTRASLRLFELGLDPSMVRVGNAEDLPFPDRSFDHVNCQGVIHHTPDTAKCVQEFHRVLAPGGTVCFSVYYKVLLLRHPGLFRLLRPLVKSLLVLRGRGRDHTLFDDFRPEEVVRKYDGADNPIGKAYTMAELREMVGPYFEVLETQRHFFPARALPFPIPSWLHKLLHRRAGLLIILRCRRKNGPSPAR